MSNKATLSNKRQSELDLLKFLAILFMVFVHTYEIARENLVFTTSMHHTVDSLIEFVGGPPAAPVFMICLGAGIVFSRKSTSQILRKRALTLFLVGFLVNIFEEILPIIWESPTYLDFIEWLPGLLATDMYYFAGLVFLIFSFIVKTKKPVQTCSILMSISLVLNVLTSGVSFTLGNIWLDNLAGLFIRLNEYSYFPLINWLPIALFGYIFGKQLIHTTNKRNLYIKLTLSGAIVMIAMMLIGKLTNNPLAALDPLCEDEAYYAYGALSVIWNIGFVVLLSGIAYMITSIYDFSKLRLVKFSNKNMMEIYCIQWLLISLFIPVITSTTNIYTVCIIATMIYILTFISAQALNEVKLLIISVRNQLKNGISLKRVMSMKIKYLIDNAYTLQTN